jgi:C1A family cysteine protease
METSRKYGWKRQLPDFRDKKYKVERQDPLPASADLSKDLKGWQEAYSQGNLGSCTANAIGRAMDIVRLLQGNEPILPSRLFIYFNERAVEGSILSDAGACIRDGIKLVARLGACQETEWPYDIAKFKDVPGFMCYIHAIQFQALEYRSIDNTSLYDLKHCIADGRPFVYGFSVYDSFESDIVAKTGIVPMPKPDENCLGGHAVCCYSYSDDDQTFTTINSWGKDFGLNGSFKIPYAYLTNPDLASDFWTITKMES